MSSPPLSTRPFWYFATTLVVGIQLTLWLAFLLWVWLCVPFYRQFFEGLVVALPVIAIWVFRLSEQLAAMWWIMIPAILSLVAIVSVAIDLSLERINRIALRLIW